MQNYYNDFEYGGGYYDGYAETEEERRKREQELANRAVQTQEIKTFGDGTVEETTKTEYAPAVQPAVAQPVAPVAPSTTLVMVMFPVQATPASVTVALTVMTLLLILEYAREHVAPEGVKVAVPKGTLQTTVPFTPFRVAVKLIVEGVGLPRALTLNEVVSAATVTPRTPVHNSRGEAANNNTSLVLTTVAILHHHFHFYSCVHPIWI